MVESTDRFITLDTGVFEEILVSELLTFIKTELHETEGHLRIPLYTAPGDWDKVDAVPLAGQWRAQSALAGVDVYVNHTNRQGNNVEGNATTGITRVFGAPQGWYVLILQGTDRWSFYTIGSDASDTTNVMVTNLRHVSGPALTDYPTGARVTFSVAQNMLDTLIQGWMIRPGAIRNMHMGDDSIGTDQYIANSVNQAALAAGAVSPTETNLTSNANKQAWRTALDLNAEKFVRLNVTEIDGTWDKVSGVTQGTNGEWSGYTAFSRIHLRVARGNREGQNQGTAIDTALTGNEVDNDWILLVQEGVRYSLLRSLDEGGGGGTPQMGYEDTEVRVEGGISPVDFPADARVKIYYGKDIPNRLLQGWMIRPDSIELRHLKNDSVDRDKIVAGAVGTTEIANSAVTAEKIPDGSIIQSKFAAGVGGSASWTTRIAGTFDRVSTAPDDGEWRPISSFNIIEFNNENSEGADVTAALNAIAVGHYIVVRTADTANMTVGKVSIVQSITDGKRFTFTDKAGVDLDSYASDATIILSHVSSLAGFFQGFDVAPGAIHNYHLQEGVAGTELVSALPSENIRGHHIKATQQITGYTAGDVKAADGTTNKATINVGDVLERKSTFWQEVYRPTATDTEFNTGTILKPPTVAQVSKGLAGKSQILVGWDGQIAGPTHSLWDFPATRKGNTSGDPYDTATKRWAISDNNADNYNLNWSNDAVDWNNSVIAFRMSQNKDNWACTVYWGSTVDNIGNDNSIRAATGAAGLWIGRPTTATTDIFATADNRWNMFAVTSANTSTTPVILNPVEPLSSTNVTINTAASKDHVQVIAGDGPWDFVIVLYERTITVYMSSTGNPPRPIARWNMTAAEASAPTGPNFGFAGDTGSVTTKRIYLYNLYIGTLPIELAEPRFQNEWVAF